MEALFSKDLQGPEADLFLPFSHQIRVLDIGFDHLKGSPLEKRTIVRSSTSNGFSCQVFSGFVSCKWVEAQFLGVIGEDPTISWA